MFHLKVRIQLCLEALSAAVTACVGMGEWEQALQLFAAESAGLSRPNCVAVQSHGARHVHESHRVPMTFVELS